MRLLVIRHGESEADLTDVHEGRADFELTPRGRRQAEAMAGFVKNRFHVTRLYASTLKRAAQTAACLSDAVKVPIRFDERLMEFNNGLLAGMPRDEAARKYPPVPDLPIDRAVYGQESQLDFRRRAEAVFASIRAEDNADGDTALVTHGGMINQLYHTILKLPVAADCFFCTGDTGIHVWEIRADSVMIVKSNLCEHTDGI